MIGYFGDVGDNVLLSEVVAPPQTRVATPSIMSTLLSRQSGAAVFSPPISSGASLLRPFVPPSPPAPSPVPPPLVQATAISPGIKPGTALLLAGGVVVVALLLARRKKGASA